MPRVRGINLSTRLRRANHEQQKPTCAAELRSDRPGKDAPTARNNLRRLRTYQALQGDFWSHGNRHLLRLVAFALCRLNVAAHQTTGVRAHNQKPGWFDVKNFINQRKEKR